MAEPAPKRMCLDEFLWWDDGTDTRYELIGGLPVAMAPPAEVHRVLAIRLGGRIDSVLSTRRPCNAQSEAGIVRPDRADTFFVAEIAATCAPIEPGRQATKDPFLIIEVLSPGTERHDRRIKLPVYRQLDSVEEILLLAADEYHAELHRRSGPQWITEILRGRDAVLTLRSAGVTIAFAALYEGVAFDETAEG